MRGAQHLWGHSYRELEFALADSRTAQRFARVDAARPPRKTALQAAVGAIRAETWERVNLALLEAARSAGIETGGQVRVDSTVVETRILAPEDSRLLFDGIRALARLLGEARERLGGQAVAFRDHRRAAKRRALEIRSQRGADRRAKLYRRLLRLARRTAGYAEAALPAVESSGAPWAASWAANVREINGLPALVADQTRRRVFEGETVPASEKVVSLFEPHTDVIRKGGRPTHYGHKVNLATGRSGLVLDAVVEDGNPADSDPTAWSLVPSRASACPQCRSAPPRPRQHPAARVRIPGRRRGGTHGLAGREARLAVRQAWAPDHQEAAPLATPSSDGGHADCTRSD